MVYTQKQLRMGKRRREILFQTFTTLLTMLPSSIGVGLKLSNPFTRADLDEVRKAFINVSDT